MKTGLTNLAGSLRRGVLLAIVVDRRWSAAEIVRELDQRSGGLLIDEAKRRRFTGRVGEMVALQTQSTLPNPVVALIGGDTATPKGLFAIAAQLSALADSEQTGQIAVRLSDPGPGSIRTVVEGVALARHRFDEYRSAPAKQRPLRLRFVVDKATSELREALHSGEIRARAVGLARDLANTPAGDLPPAVLGETRLEAGVRCIARQGPRPGQAREARDGGLAGSRPRKSEHPAVNRDEVRAARCSANPLHPCGQRNYF